MDRALRADEVNRPVYSEPDVVRYYARASALQPAEKSILDTLSSRLSTSRMLDLGVGGGRTTVHFAPRVRKYVGLDYSPAMIAAARERFVDHEFVLGDARELPFADASFDFVLFSHNGIDYVEHADRIRILGEVRRVLSVGGLFVFSTHNLDRDDLDFSASHGENTIRRLLRSPRRSRLRKNNPSYESLAEVPHAMVNDGSFHFRAATYHIRLAPQLDQLGAVGFAGTRVYSGRTGDEIAPCDPVTVGDPWLYFVASPA